jgi:ribosomal protein S4
MVANPVLFDWQMKHPSYLLNPGDMFTVDIESVLYATGAPKNSEEEVKGRGESSFRPAQEEDIVEEVAEEDEPEEPEEDLEEEELQPNDPDIITTRLTTLRDLRNLAEVLQTQTKGLKPKRKTELRDLHAQTKRLLSKIRSVSSEQITELESNFESVLAKLDNLPSLGSEAPSTFRQIRTNRNPTEDTGESHPSKYRTKRAAAAAADLDNHLSRLSLIPNPVDESKTYKTPWRPRDYMSPFAFVPRYLEVNHTVCSAVYLRHPVVRPGLAEVPTPFSLGTGSLAFAWYLRRR